MMKRSDNFFEQRKIIGEYDYCPYLIDYIMEDIDLITMLHTVLIKLSENG